MFFGSTWKQRVEQSKNEQDTFIKICFALLS